MFYNMMKQNTSFKGDGRFVHRLLITNSKLSFMKTFLWTWFESPLSDDIFKTNFEKFEPKKSIYRNFKQYDTDQFKLDIFNSMSAMENPCSLWK